MKRYSGRRSLSGFRSVTLVNRPVVFRTATPSDADAIAEVYLASRQRFLPYAPLAHSDESVRRWIAQHLIPDTKD
jgi:hypothetical protein